MAWHPIALCYWCAAGLRKNSGSHIPTCHNTGCRHGYGRTDRLFVYRQSDIMAALRRRFGTDRPPPRLEMDLPLKRIGPPKAFTAATAGEPPVRRARPVMGGQEGLF